MSPPVPFDADRLLALPPRETVATHDHRDVILYALGVGAGIEDPLSDQSLRYVYEKRLQVLPSMATVLAFPGFWLAEPSYGIDWKRVLHAGQSLELHGVLPVEGQLVSRLVIEDIVDKGADKGALLYSKRDIYDVSTGDHLATDRRSTFLRGDGGKGGRSGGSPPAHRVPDRPADRAVRSATRPDLALLYRLSGDRNPLHADPAVAAAAGFRLPILHGLCTYGIVCRALLQSLCADDATMLRRLDCRFTTPVYPGESIITEIWRESTGVVSFRARVKERNVIAIDNGLAHLDV